MISWALGLIMFGAYVPGSHPKLADTTPEAPSATAVDNEDACPTADNSTAAAEEEK